MSTVYYVGSMLACKAAETEVRPYLDICLLNRAVNIRRVTFSHFVAADDGPYLPDQAFSLGEIHVSRRLVTCVMA